MKIISMIVVRITAIAGLLAAGFALGFPLGQEKGFHTGSEWALVQMEIVAREAGVSLPFLLEGGQIRVIVRQPAGLHAWARKQASREEQGVKYDLLLDQNEWFGYDGLDQWIPVQAKLLPAPVNLVQRGPFIYDQ